MSAVLQDFIAGAMVSAILWTARVFGIDKPDYLRGMAFVGSLIAGLVVAGTASGWNMDSLDDVLTLAIGALVTSQALFVLLQGKLTTSMQTLRGKMFPTPPPPEPEPVTKAGRGYERKSPR